MDTIVLVGYIAGALTTIAFVPQVIKAWKLRRRGTSRLPCSSSSGWVSFSGPFTGSG